MEGIRSRRTGLVPLKDHPRPRLDASEVPRSWELTRLTLRRHTSISILYSKMGSSYARAQDSPELFRLVGKAHAGIAEQESLFGRSNWQFYGFGTVRGRHKLLADP